jgi:hypothetical protein
VFEIDKTKALGRVLLDAIAPQPDESMRDWSARAKQWGIAHPAHPASLELKRRFFSGHGDARDFVWFVSWTLNGFPRVLLATPQADMFMATNAGDDPEVMAFAPWSAYTLELPYDTLQVAIDGRIVSFDVVQVVHHATDLDNGFVIRGRASDYVISGRLEFPLPDWPDGSPTVVRDNAEVLDRVRDSVARLIVSVELEMSNRENVILPSTTKPKMGKSLNDPAAHRLKRIVTIDCRAAIKDYLSGDRGKSPSVRWLARGHWKLQPHGPHNSLRKSIHIEPYWNPKDPEKPVAERPHRLKRKKTR